MKRCMIITFALSSLWAAAPAAFGNGWAMNSEEATEWQMRGYRGMSPKQIARQFHHPSGFVNSFAIKAMADHGDAALPLLDDLVSDDHPYIRQGALASMIEISKRKYGDNIQDTPETRKLISRMKELIGDLDLARSVARFLSKAKIETEAVHEIAIELAASTEVDVRTSAIAIGGFIKDADTQVKIGMAASAGPKNIPRTWGKAHALISRHKNDPVCRQGIPVVAAFMRDSANSIPVRGMFSDGPQIRALEVIEAQWDSDVQAMPDVVPAVCRSYVRAPYSTYPGWLTNRTIATRLVTKLDKNAVPAMRATIAEDKQWLKEMTEEAAKVGFQNKGATGRKKAAEFIAYLEYLADTLEAGEKVTRKPIGPPEIPKDYEDKVPDPDRLDLDNILDGE